LTFSDVYKFLGLDIVVDIKSRIWDLTLGPLKIKSIPFSLPKELTSNQQLVGQILVECFVQRRVMWQDFRRETPNKCEASLTELALILEPFASKFSGSSAEADKVFAQALLHWKAMSVLATKEIKDAIDVEEKDRADWRSGALIDSDEIQDARTSLNSILSNFRKAILPTVAFLIDLLAESDPLRAEAEALRIEASETLMRDYSVGLSDLRTPEWQLSSTQTA
jgi:hypothetical protein